SDMTISAQVPVFTPNNWLSTGDFLNFAKRIWPAADFDMVAVERKVEDFYGDACKRYPTYETMVLRAFCCAMEAEFGSENKDSKSAAAFAYAREEFGYLNPSEMAAQDQADADDGLCFHGLDSMTCPCGCFEND
ncbi:TPA: hypothetical protein ACNIM8_005903, partial [Pseudomonas aeruginosa]